MVSFHDTKIGNDRKRASSEISHRIPYHCRRITLSHIFFTTISIAISLTYDSRLTKNISFRHATKFFVNRHPSVAFILSSFVFIYCDLIKSLFAWEFFFFDWIILVIKPTSINTQNMSVCRCDQLAVSAVYISKKLENGAKVLRLYRLITVISLVRIAESLRNQYKVERSVSRISRWLLLIRNYWSTDVVFVSQSVGIAFLFPIFQQPPIPLLGRTTSSGSASVSVRFLFLWFPSALK